MTFFKKTILFIHRWLGFITGLVVFIISITGCIFCFQDEIQDTFHSEYRKVTVINKPPATPSVLKALALKEYPKGKILSILYFGPDRSAQVRVTVAKKLYSLFFNPYDGKLLYVDKDFRHNFFNSVKEIHEHLFLPPEVGKIVNGTSVIIFVLIMITGIILWWPKRKSDRKRSFTIKWKGKLKRVNYDLHNVLGFYATAFILILAVTGLNIAFDWVEDSIYAVANMGKTYPAEKKKFKSDTLQKGRVTAIYPAIDVAYQTVMRQSPNARMLIIIPGAKASSVISVSAYPKALNFSFSDGYSFDQYTGKLLKYLPYNQKSPGLQFANMNYDIHVGQIAGLAGKILMFLASLIAATLPVTGLIIYLGKKKKPKGKRAKRMTLAKPVL